MEAFEHTADEIKQLRSCVNDLVSIIALPAIWGGGDAAHIVRTLLDVLMDMLHLDFVYVRLENSSEYASVEVARFAQPQSSTVNEQEIGIRLRHILGEHSQHWPQSVRRRIGKDDISIAPLRLGLQGEIGLIVAGSTRQDFPRQTENLLLRVAANQVVIGLHEARLLSEQRRVASELDQRVAQRTSELAEANEHLKREMGERRTAEEALGKVRSELAHAARITSLGALTASIAHEVNQPLGAVITNAEACLRWLNRPTPDLNEAREAVRRIIRDGKRGSEVIGRIRLLLKNEEPSKARVDVNETIQATAGLAQNELSGTDLQLNLAKQLPCVTADRVQLQQVLLNLILNAIDSMKSLEDCKSVLRITTKPHKGDAVLVAVKDSGRGLQPGTIDQLFETFFTTKSKGLGMGLSISRSIVESHGGQLWAEPNDGPGATFLFTLPAENGGPA